MSTKTGSPLEPVATSAEMLQLMVIFSEVHGAFMVALLGFNAELVAAYGTSWDLT